MAYRSDRNSLKHWKSAMVGFNDEQNGLNWSDEMPGLWMNCETTHQFLKFAENKSFRPAEKVFKASDARLPGET